MQLWQPAALVVPVLPVPPVLDEPVALGQVQEPLTGSQPKDAQAGSVVEVQALVESQKPRPVDGLAVQKPLSHWLESVQVAHSDREPPVLEPVEAPPVLVLDEAALLDDDVALLLLDDVLLVDAELLVDVPELLAPL